MRAAFGQYIGVLSFPEEEAAPDPSRPDPRARREMDAFDRLTPEARAAVANSRFGVCVADTVENVVRRGAPNPVKEALQARGLMPCDIGTEGVLLEIVSLSDEAEAQRLRREFER